MAKTVIWNGEGGSGLEKLRLDRRQDAIIAKSHATGGDKDLHTMWDVEYEIICDINWQVRGVSIAEKTTGHHLALRSDGAGIWTDGNGREVEAIRGCIDIDFRATPFSNTFPIGRLHLAVGEMATIAVAYINAPDLKVTREEQVYTRLSNNTWKFAQPSANFEVTITVDDEGFVVDYPGLFTRVKQIGLSPS